VVALILADGKNACTGKIRVAEWPRRQVSR
jgi:hypothetical protein